MSQRGIRLWGLFVAAMLAGPAAGWAQVSPCAVSLEFFVTAEQLAATKAAVARGELPILILGGSAAAGAAARGAEFTYPARLVARLHERLPGVSVTTTVRAAPRRSTNDVLKTLDADLAGATPALVIWGPGGSAAARGEDVDAFTDTVQAVIDRTRAARTDLVLMTLQYGPSVGRVLNLTAYRMAVLFTGEMADIPVFDRYEFMRFWHAGGLVNLDATEPADQVAVARKVFDCMAEVMANGIADALQ